MIFQATENRERKKNRKTVIQFHYCHLWIIVVLSQSKGDTYYNTNNNNNQIPVRPKPTPFVEKCQNRWPICHTKQTVKIKPLTIYIPLFYSTHAGHWWYTLLFKSAFFFHSQPNLFFAFFCYKYFIYVTINETVDQSTHINKFPFLSAVNSGV